MSDHIDNFFKAKLADHAMTPSTEAWSKVEINLSKKNKGLIWLRAAALLLSGLLLGTILWLQSSKSKPIPTALSQVEAPVPKENPRLESTNSNDVTVITPFPAASTQSHNNVVNKERNQNLKKEIQLIDQNTIATEEVMQTISLPSGERRNEEMALACQEKIKKPIVLEFRLETIAKPNSDLEVNEQDVAIADSKNGLQKAINYAIEVKNGDSPVLNIRQAKDNLFALNFKKDKKAITKQ